MTKPDDVSQWAATVLEALERAEDYFDNRADAEYFTDSPTPVANEEMGLMNDMLAAIEAFPKALDAAYAKGQAEREWMSIETAPKDGTRILVHRESDYGTIIASWESDETKNPDWDGESDFSCWWDEAFGWLEDDLTPTHWKPLGDGPAQAIRKGEGHE